jgi:AraC-like DNA-binding protein
VTYRERPARPDGAVAWTRAPGPGEVRVLPDGCIDLLWVDGSLFVAGPDTQAKLHEADKHFAGLRFEPGAAPALLNVPAVELRDQRVPLGAVWPGAVARRFAEQVGDEADPALALERLVALTPPEPWVRDLVDGLRAGRSVAALADAEHLSERQLHRRCLALFGYGAKTLARVLRMERAVDLARGGMAFGSVAVAAGYADQAHLAHEVRDLAGVPLRQLTQAGV